MSTIVYGGKSLSLAAGFRWSVLSAPTKAGKKAGKSDKSQTAVRLAARSVGATRYVVDAFDGQKYVGLYTQGLSTADMERSNQRRIHSLATVFINAMLQSSELDRSALYGILVTSPTSDHHQGDTRAVVIIEGGRIVHDGIETRVRAAEIVHEHRARQMQFQLFCDLEEYEEMKLIDWPSLVGYADKSTLSSAVPRNPAQYLAILGALVGMGLYGAYHVMVVIPERAAEEARRKAEQDRTPQYLQALQAAMERVGWSAQSMDQHLSKLGSEIAFHKGWALKGLECNVSACTETWARHGGVVTDLMQMRPNSTYQPEGSVADKGAVLQGPVAGEPMKLTMEMLPKGGIPVHVALKPALNRLENAGATGQLGESMTWPVMPMTGVRPDVVVRRTRLEIHYKLPFASQALAAMPVNFVPESFVLAAEQGMSISIKGYVYEK